MPTQSFPPHEPQDSTHQSDAAFYPRRSFLGGLLAAGTAGVGALLIIPVIRFVLYPVLATTTEKSWSDVGKADEFQSSTAPDVRRTESQE